MKKNTGQQFETYVRAQQPSKKETCWRMQVMKSQLKNELQFDHSNTMNYHTHTDWFLPTANHHIQCLNFIYQHLHVGVKAGFAPDTIRDLQSGPRHEGPGSYRNIPSFPGPSLGIQPYLDRWYDPTSLVPHPPLPHRTDCRRWDQES